MSNLILNANPTSLYDNFKSQGLDGAHDSIGYRIAELERHMHAFERWLEPAAAPVGETHVADNVNTGTGAGSTFQIDAGNNDWGAWVQILGSNDTPVKAGSAYFDFHDFFIEAVERQFLYYIQISFGETAAAGIAANTYCVVPYKPQTVQAAEVPLAIQNRRTAVGTKVWCRCKCPTQDTATLNFIIGIHEYEG